MWVVWIYLKHLPTGPDKYLSLERQQIKHDPTQPLIKNFTNKLIIIVYDIFLSDWWAMS